MDTDEHVSSPPTLIPLNAEKMAVPNVVDFYRHAMPTYDLPGALVHSMTQTTLRPGQSIVIGQTALGFSTDDSYPRDAFSRLLAGPGKYRISLEHRIQRDGRGVILWTGEMPFELADKPH